MLGAVTILSYRHLTRVTELRANAQVAQADCRKLARTAQLALVPPRMQQVWVGADDDRILVNAGFNANAGGLARGSGAVMSVAAGGMAMVKTGPSMVADEQQAMWIDIGAVIMIGLLSVSLTGWWVARMISRPIRWLGDAVDRLGAGEEPSHLKVVGIAEVQRLQQGFNRMAAALIESRSTLQSSIGEAASELARQNQQLELAKRSKLRLWAAASHDLRQPLHALMLFSDGLVKGETNPLRLQRIKCIRECVETLNLQFGALMDFSQLEAGVLKPKWSEFALDRLFDEINRNFRLAAEQQGLRLVVRKTDAWVRCDYVMLTRVLNNLVANSLRYTWQGGLLVGARRRGRGIRIDVWDTGIGIAPQHQKRVFEEFYQVDPQGGNGATRGIGLGLATVQQLAALLDIPVELTSVPGRGTCVRVTVCAAAS